MKKQKTIERICRNCKLYNSENGECSIVILWEGNKQRIPVDAEDPCFFEGQYFDPLTKQSDDFAGHIQEVKLWVEDESGKKIAGDGIVKIEYPDGFFGDTTLDQIT